MIYVMFLGHMIFAVRVQHFSSLQKTYEIGLFQVALLFLWWPFRHPHTVVVAIT